jgi:magnesium-transporting ATPase (P-type)
MRSGQVDETVGPWECKNLVFMGCMCVKGKGMAVVIKTGKLFSY